MNALSSKIGETINLVVPDRLNMIYLDRVETNWPLRIQLPIGTQVPFHCTASGKLYLSTLPSYRLMPIINAGGFKKMAKRTITAPKSSRRRSVASARLVSLKTMKNLLMEWLLSRLLLEM